MQNPTPSTAQPSADRDAVIVTELEAMRRNVAELGREVRAATDRLRNR